MNSAERLIARVIEWLAAVAFAAALGLELAGIWVLQDGKAQAAALAKQGDYASAIATDLSLQQLSGPAFALAKIVGLPKVQDVQGLYVQWANTLAQQGDIANALGVAASAPVTSQEPLQRQQILLAAVQNNLAKKPDLAWEWMQVLIAAKPVGAVATQLKDARAQVDLSSAPALSANQRANDGVVALDDAIKNGNATQIASANQQLPETLLAAGQQLSSQTDYGDSATTLQRLVNDFGSSASAATARNLLGAGQAVAGTLLDGGGGPILTQVRLDAKYTISSGLLSYGPYYSATSDAHGDFRIANVPLGGPYAIELFRDGNWEVLLHAPGQAQTVSVTSLQPQDLTYLIVS